MCAANYCIDEFRRIKTTAASDTKVPILKHVKGVFGLIDASRKSLKRQSKKKGASGSGSVILTCPSSHSSNLIVPILRWACTSDRDGKDRERWKVRVLSD
jgi:hypothetical protein